MRAVAGLRGGREAPAGHQREGPLQRLLAEPRVQTHEDEGVQGEVEAVDGVDDHEGRLLPADVHEVHGDVGEVQEEVHEDEDAEREADLVPAEDPSLVAPPLAPPEAHLLGGRPDGVASLRKMLMSNAHPM